MKRVGIDVGSLYFKAVIVDEDGARTESSYLHHHGNPWKAFRDWAVDMPDLHEDVVMGVTGSLEKLPAGLPGMKVLDVVRCLMEGARSSLPCPDGIIDVGGSSLTLVELASDGGFSSFRGNSLCAAGTGSFLDEQAKRLGVRYEDLSTFPMIDDPPSIASRCAVFAKSDLIHRQQEGCSREEMWSGLCRGLTQTLLHTLFKGRPVSGQIAITGGVSQNLQVRRWMAELAPDADLAFLDDGHLATALGASLLVSSDAGVSPVPWSQLVKGLLPLIDEANLGGGRAGLEADDRPLELKLSEYPTFEVEHAYEDEHGTEVRVTNWPGAGGEVPCYVGIDVGSTSTKAVIIDEDARVLADLYRKTLGDPIGAVRHLFSALEEIEREQSTPLRILGAGTTGSGRKLMGQVVGADVIINEITAHVIGALSTDPDVETIFEIGGQDSKFVRLRGGNVVDSNMNYICAAGTGSFVEEQAGKLGFKVSEVGSKVIGIVPPPTSDRCTVFMEQDVNALIRRGYSPEEAMAGVMRSVVQNYLNKVVGRRTVSKSKIAFMGATARNKGLVAAFEQQMDCPIVVSPYCHVMGAYGVSLAVRAEKAAHPSPTTFRGLDLVRRKVELRHETCELCNNACRITHAHIESEKSVPSWGYLCGRDPEEKKAKIRREYDLFRKRERFLRQAGKGVDVPENAPVIGLPLSLTTYVYRPLWTRFFNALGFKVVTSVRSDESVKERSLELVSADFCFPVKLVYGHVDRLLKKEGVDHVFLPHMVANHLNDFTTDAQFCTWVQGMPSAVKTAFRQYGVSIDPILSPVIDFRWTDRMLVDSLVKTLGSRIGRGRADIERAWRTGLEAQRSFERSCVTEGKRGLRKLKESGKVGIVVLGRPYNVFDSGANVGLPEKIAEYGYTVVPVDFLPFRPELLGERYRNTYWNYGQRILSALRQVRENDSLYPVYLTNFSCGPDSFLLSYAEDIMGDKPMLILELDEHGADAGYITRVEAFLDVLKADRPEQRRPRVDVFAPPSVWASRRVWIPPMHELGSEMFSATFRRFGFKSEPLPLEDLEAFDLGRRLTRGSECLPTAATLGSFVKTLRDLDADPSKEALFMPTAEGPCRFGQYATSHRLALEKIGMDDVAILSPSSYNSYGGLPQELRKLLWDAILLADILFKMGCKVRPYEVVSGQTDEVLGAHLHAASHAMESGDDLRDALGAAVEAFLAIETRQEKKPLVGVVGEIYVRCNGFCNSQVIRTVEQYGGEGWLAPVSEWILYTSEMAKRGARIGINANLLKSPFSFIMLHLKDRFLHKKERQYHEVAHKLLHDRLEPHVSDVIDAGERYIPLA
ncbi:MAG: hypothetical protein JRG91_13595, partial [Deltaproteobacteria bacterium]|nr:hypothetical protein [Deltaproteobacteria bacterium]